MTFRTSITVLGLLGLLVALPAQSQGLPAPTEPLKDYEAVGVMHVELPPPPRAEGSRSSEVGFTAFYPFRQVYARPDRLLTVLRAGAGVQAMRAAFDRERVYNPANGFVVERIFKNMDPNAPSPMESTALSMAGSPSAFW